MKTNKLGWAGVYTLVHKDINGKVLSVEEVPNLITNEGKNAALNYALGGDTAPAAWYFRIYTSGSAAAGNTYATPNRTESSNYDEANRQAWDEGAAGSQSITNGTPATITASTGGITATGIGLVGSPSAAATIDDKGDTATGDGVLFSDNDITKTLAQGETLDITYTVNA